MSVGTNSDGRRHVRIEPGIRHAELVLSDLGLEGSKVKPLTTPGFKLDERELALRETEVPLEATDATRYRSCVIRLSYFFEDRADPWSAYPVLWQSRHQGISEISRGLHAVCWVPNTWPFICFVKLLRTSFRPALTASSLDVVRPVRAQHSSNGWRTCCEAHVESSRCNWFECFRV